MTKQMMRTTLFFIGLVTACASDTAVDTARNQLGGKGQPPAAGGLCNPGLVLCAGICETACATPAPGPTPLPTSTSMPAPGPSPAVMAVTDIFTGFTTCALLQNGAIKCWGANNQGQLGNGSALASSSTPVLATLGPAHALRRRASSQNSQCAILNDNTVWCWGSAAMALPAQATVFGSDVEDVAGECILRTSDKGVSCLDNAGALIAMTTLGTNVRSLTSFDKQSYCAVTSTNALYCWGNNTNHRVGQPTPVAPTPSPVPNVIVVPTLVPGVGDVDFTMLSYGVGYAVKTTGEFFAWGATSMGLGLPKDRTVALFPMSTDLMPQEYVRGTEQYVQGSAADSHAMFVTSTGKVLRAGLRGGGSTSALIASSGAKRVATNLENTCVIFTDGTLKCLGRNEAGQLGNDTTTDSPTLVNVVGL
jgi:alpha-tubulin suppressor-like RCC1 family protein